jgi:membrane protein
MGEATWRLIRGTMRSLRGRDLALHAAAVTFYGGIAVVPVALLTVWLAGLVAGQARVRRLMAYPIGDFPTAIGADRALAALVEAGLTLTPVLAVAALKKYQFQNSEPVLAGHVLEVHVLNKHRSYQAFQCLQ